MADHHPPLLPSPGPESARTSDKKLKLPWRPDTTGARRTRAFATSALGFLEKATSLAASISGDVGVPGLAAGLAILRDVLQAIQTMSTTVAGVETLCDRIGQLVSAMAGFCARDRGQPLPEAMRERLRRLVDEWTNIGAEARGIKKRNWVSRFLKSGADAAKLEELVRKIDTSISEFLLQGGLVVEEEVHRILDVVETVQKGVTATLEASFMPVYAKKAQYDANEVRRPCLEGTRVDILTRLRQWVIAACAYRDGTSGDNPGNIFWINGLAGTGKTTIAYSVSQLCKELGILGATFFCSRFDAECSEPGLIFVTISRQLSRYHVLFRKQVEGVLREDPDIVHSNPTRQFEELIVRPLEALKGSFPKVVIVLDALDECKDKGATSTTLTVLARFISRVKDFLVFVVTSRPEPHITALFDAARKDSLRKDAPAPLLLHMVALESVLDDIRRYLVHEFEARAGTRRVPPGWPSAQEVAKLSEMSHGLFIWAATAVLFIMESMFGHPPAQLQSLIDMPETSNKGNTVLNALYNQIADAASTKIPDEFQGHFRLIIGTIAVAREPLSTTALAGLLDLPSSDMVHNFLLGVRSVLHVPDEPDKPIRVIHPTFPEFLLASAIPKPGAFCIDTPSQHFTLFSRSLAVMGDLKCDIAGIGDPLLFKSEVPTLAEDVGRCLPQSTRYACRHWGDHLQGAVGSSDMGGIAGPFLDFLHHRVLNWFEACSLSDGLDAAVLTLDSARRVCQALGGSFVDLVQILADCQRFLLTYIGCIETAPLQVYHSALALAPERSFIKRNYAAQLEDSLSICSGAVSDWGPCLDVLRGHEGFGALSIAFSPDGNCFATGGADGRIEIRRSTTRALLLTIGGRRSVVCSIAFSPDGSRVVSGSSDGRLRVWHATSGDRIQTFKGHTDEVWSVEYSADGTRVLSASSNEVVLWDAANGRCLLTLPTLNHYTWQAALSPDGRDIACRADAGACVYNIASGARTLLPLPRPAHATAFSRDGCLIAAASETAIRVWTTAGHEVVRSIDVASCPLRLAFSHDGTRISCGMTDGAVSIWEVRSEGSAYVLRGHTDAVCAVAWSPDGTQIISASEDDNVRVWEGVPTVAPRVQRVPSDRRLVSPDIARSTLLCQGDGLHIIHVPFPPDIEHLQPQQGTPTLSLHPDAPAAWDAAFLSTEAACELDMGRCTRSRDWELLTGQRVIQANWRPVAISPDYSLIAYLPKGVKTDVHIYNLRTGQAVAALVGHTDDVRSVAFSTDGARIVTGSQDLSVRVWVVATGAAVAAHSAHTLRLRTAEFSSDGRLVVSGAGDNTVQIFDVAAGRITHVYPHQTTVVKATFSADDAHVLSLDYFRDVMVWDLANGACIYQVSLAGTAWTRSLDFTPDGTGIVVHNFDDHTRTTVALRQSCKRTWPAYHVSNDGWVTAKSPGIARRLCWLPPEWRAVFPLGGARFCALDLDRRVSVVFDVSRVRAYAEAWGGRVRV